MLVPLAGPAGAEITGGRAGGWLGGAPGLARGAARGAAPGDRATIRDTNFNFTLELPDGFVAAPEVIHKNPTFLHAYGLGRRDSNGVSITLVIQRFGRTLDRDERIPASEFTDD